MFVFVLIFRGWLLLVLVGLVFLVFDVYVQWVLVWDKVKVDVLQQCMIVVEKCYGDVLLLVVNVDFKGSNEVDVVLEDMEDVFNDCVKQKGCQMGILLVSYKWLFKYDVDVVVSDDVVDEGGDCLEVDLDYIGLFIVDVFEVVCVVVLLNDKWYVFDMMVEYNLVVQVGICCWLIDMCLVLLISYENYQNLCVVMWLEWEKCGLFEVLLFGIMVKEFNGCVYVFLCVGVVGLMQFMLVIGCCFGLGLDGIGFDICFDVCSVVEVSVSYFNECLCELNNNVEMLVVVYNGGEGCVVCVFKQSGGQSFWIDSVYNQFLGEIKDYVLMVIVVVWIFLYLQQYGVEFLKISVQLVMLWLVKFIIIYELIICLGSYGICDGYMCVLCNFNLCYEVDGWILVGMLINVIICIVGLYQ